MRTAPLRAALRAWFGHAFWAAACLSCGEVDTCLDRGGSYDYQLGRCDFSSSHVGPNAPCVKGILGTWKVEGYAAPGAAISDEAAAAWMNRAARYDLSRAAFDASTCDEPDYSTDVVSAGEFMDGFRVPPSLVGLPDSSVCITEIRCSNGKSNWMAPGSILVHSPPHLMTTWDGVFFVLARSD
jgi:hypothetical protein